MIDPNLKVLIEANSNALAALLAKIASGDLELTEEISHVSATDADVRAAIAEVPTVEPPTPTGSE